MDRMMPRLLLGASLVAVLPLLMGAASNGCGGDVTVGSDDPPQEGECVVTGCSGQLCADEETASDCEWTAAYACYSDFGVCERDQAGDCGWVESPELVECLADPREPVSEACVRNAGDSCETDDDCTSGGCGGELCFNPAQSSDASDCDCTAPSLGCGCVDGSCTWFQ